MPSRKPFLISPGAFLAFAVLTGCVDIPEESESKQPPPVVGSKQKPSTASNATSGAQAPATSAPGSSARVMTASAADGGTAPPRAAVMAEGDLDAGPGSGDQGPAGGAAGSGSTAGRAAAGSGGRSGSGGMRAAGAGGRGGAGEQAGASGDVCMNELCFTVVDCWLLGAPQCGFTECADFICK